MLPASLAFAWLMWRRFRPGLLIVLGLLLGEAILSAVLPPYCSIDVVQGVVGLVLTLTLPPLAMYLLVVFCHGAEGTDVLARESCFPAGFFRLPVRTGSLVVWPMVYGAAVAVLLWLFTAWFILRPWLALLDDSVPMLWPAMVATASLAWVQALLWTPFGLRGFRLAMLSALPLGLIAAPGISVYINRHWQGDRTTGISEEYVAAMYAGLTLVAWAASYLGVKHARRGDVPDWGAFLKPLRQLARWLPPRRTPFVFAARAQAWFEWRLTGHTLATMTGLVLPFSLIPLLFARNDVIPTEQTLLSALTIPVYLAGLAGGWPGTGRNRWVKDRSGIMPFIATLPMSTADLIGAMLRAAAWSTLAAWMVVVLIVPSAVMLTGHFDEVEEWRQQLRRVHSAAEIAAGIVAITAWLLVWTWKRKVDSLYLGLPGRGWVTGSIALVCLPGSFALWFVALWIYRHPEIHDIVLRVLPTLLGVVVFCRLLLAAWALQQALRQGLLQPQTVARWAAGWVLLASVLFGLFAWAVPPELVPRYYLAYGVLFALPMARLAAAPLTLAWNRHR
jgi:hypothetical protein